MGKKKPRRVQAEGQPGSISADAVERAQKFVYLFKQHFIEICHELRPTGQLSDYDEAMIQAVFKSFADLEVSSHLYATILPQFIGDRGSEGVEWSDELNRRRFELIDKKYHKSISAAEEAELDRLTQVMREQIDTEANLPISGVEELYRRLLENRFRSKPQ